MLTSLFSFRSQNSGSRQNAAPCRSLCRKSQGYVMIRFTEAFWRSVRLDASTLSLKRLQ